MWVCVVLGLGSGIICAKHVPYSGATISALIKTFLELIKDKKLNRHTINTVLVNANV